MLNKLISSGLTILIFFIFSGNAYSQNSYMYGYYFQSQSNARAYAPSYYADLPRPKNDPYYTYMHINDSYAEDTDVEPARAVYISTQYIKTGNDRSEVNYVIYRKYVRPSEQERIKEETYMVPMGPPVITNKTSIGVPPFGYKYYTKNTNAPIRDFRTDLWLTKQYTSASEKNNIIYDDKTGAFYTDPNDQ